MESSGDISLHFNFLLDRAGSARSVPVAFILNQGILFTLRNIESLNSHTSFLFDKINFLMDATIGFININQNRRINKLTVFGVVFMPINILAGMGGMGGMSEFSMMTQGVPWPVAYGSFFVVSCLLGGATFFALRYFEKREGKGAKMVSVRKP